MKLSTTALSFSFLLYAPFTQTNAFAAVQEAVQEAGVPNFSVQAYSKSSEPHAWTFVFTPPAKHHFNLEAPKKLSVTTKSFFKKNSTFESTKPTSVLEQEIAFEVKDPNITEQSEYEASAFICDDAKTYCFKKSVKGLVLKTQAKDQEKNQEKNKSREPQTVQKSVPKPKTISLRDHLGFWDNAPEMAWADAKMNRLPVLIDFYGIWCPPCNLLNETVFLSEEFKKISEKYVLLKMDADLESSWKLKDHYKISGYPTLIIADANQKELVRIVGAPQTQDLVAKMVQVIKKKPSSPLEVLEALADRKEWKSLKNKIKEFSRDKNTKSAYEVDFKIYDLLAYEKPLWAQATVMKDVFSNLKKVSAENLFRVADDWIAGFTKFTDEQKSKTAPEMRKIVEELVSRVDPKTLYIPKTEFTLPDVQSLQVSILEALHETSESGVKLLKESQNQAILAYQNFMRHYGIEHSRGQTLELASLFRQAGKYEEAKKIYEKMIERYPNEFTYYYHYARMEMQLKKWDSALEKITRAYAYAYGDNKIRVAEQWVNVLIEQGKKKEAYGLAQKTLNEFKDPKNFKVRTSRYLKSLREKVEQLKNQS